MKEIIDYLKNNNYTISTMESCTGGYIASSITNISGSSMVFKFGAVTYSNEYKIKLGVEKDIIDKYSVYSMECANSMSKVITDYTNSDYGVGITGKINDIDPNNLIGDDNKVYLSIYDRNKDFYYNKEIIVKNISREENKELINEEFIELFKEQIIKSY